MLLIAILALAQAADACESGLKVGERPGPYSSIVSVGPQRGQSHCFICETADKPAIILFAKTPTKALGKLAQQLDKLVLDPKHKDLRCWITFTSDDQPGVDPKIVAWARQHGLRSVPCGVFEDVGGPPTYRLNKEADVTALLYVNQRVAANFAWRAGELTDSQMQLLVKALPKIVGEKKQP